jgi:hypothetical protein
MTKYYMGLNQKQGNYLLLITVVVVIAFAVLEE